MSLLLSPRRLGLIPYNPIVDCFAAPLPDSPTASTIMTHATTGSGASANTIMPASSSRLPDLAVCDCVATLDKCKSRLECFPEDEDTDGHETSTEANARYLAYPDLNPGRAISEDKLDDDMSLIDYVLVEEAPSEMLEQVRLPHVIASCVHPL